jgi:hypothetical protein
MTNDLIGYAIGSWWLAIGGSNSRVVQFRWCYDITDGQGCVLISTIQQLPYNQWTHICAMVDGDYYAIYLDGAPVATRIIYGATRSVTSLDVDNLYVFYLSPSSAAVCICY